VFLLAWLVPSQFGADPREFLTKQERTWLRENGHRIEALFAHEAPLEAYPSDDGERVGLRVEVLRDIEPDALVFGDTVTLRLLDVNSAALRLYGYTRDELLGMRASELSAEPESTATAMREGRDHIPVRYHRRKDGTIFPAEIKASTFTWHGRRVQFAAIRDITERRRMEEAVRESERRFRELAENIRGVFWVFDWTIQQVLYVSPAYEDVWGRPVQWLLTNYEEWGQSIHPDDRQHAEENLRLDRGRGTGASQSGRAVG
jgi:PAS domain S-box-containing protein